MLSKYFPLILKKKTIQVESIQITNENWSEKIVQFSPFLNKRNEYKQIIDIENVNGDVDKDKTLRLRGNSMA